MQMPFEMYKNIRAVDDYCKRKERWMQVTGHPSHGWSENHTGPHSDALHEGQGVATIGKLLDILGSKGWGLKEIWALPFLAHPFCITPQSVCDVRFSPRVQKDDLMRVSVGIACIIKMGLGGCRSWLKPILVLEQDTGMRFDLIVLILYTSRFWHKKLI